MNFNIYYNFKYFEISINKQLYFPSQNINSKTFELNKFDAQFSKTENKGICSEKIFGTFSTALKVTLSEITPFSEFDNDRKKSQIKGNVQFLDHKIRINSGNAYISYISCTMSSKIINW